MILVEWDEYKSLDFRELVSSMSKPSYLIDTRNLYTKDQIEGVGIAYRGIGK